MTDWLNIDNQLEIELLKVDRCTFPWLERLQMATNLL